MKRMRRSASIPSTLLRTGCVHPFDGAQGRLWLNTNSLAYAADRTCVRFRTLFELRPGPLPRVRHDARGRERSGGMKRMRRSASIPSTLLRTGCVHPFDGAQGRLWLNTNSLAYAADRTCVRFRTLFELRPGPLPRVRHDAIGGERSGG